MGRQDKRHTEQSVCMTMTGQWVFRIMGRHDNGKSRQWVKCIVGSGEQGVDGTRGGKWVEWTIGRRDNGKMEQGIDGTMGRQNNV